jgi:hypothetical protein
MWALISIYYTRHSNFRVTFLHGEKLVANTTTITAALNSSLLSDLRCRLTSFTLTVDGYDHRR